MVAGAAAAAGRRGGSQRARDILQAMGAAAFQWFPITTGFGPNGHTRLQRPLSGRQIAQLKKEHLLAGRAWPYEEQSPVELREKKWPAKWPKGHKRDREAAQRQVEIAKNMELMPKWLAAAKARKRLPDDVSRADKYFLTRKQLYNKYVRSRQQKTS